jgi:hypothetical protein
MPFTYEIDEGRRLVVMTADARATQDEWFETFDRVLEDPRFRPGFDFVYDRTNVAITPDALNVRSLVGRYLEVSRRAGGGRLAVVVDKTVAYGMVRMASAWTDTAGASVNAFRSMDEALFWLATGPAVDPADDPPETA